MSFEIIPKNQFVEVHVSGDLSHWDLLKIIYQLHRNDPKKETPDLWVLDRDLSLSLHSFPTLIQGIATLAVQCMIKTGCKSAILAADELQKAKADLYCTEASVLPYTTKSFTVRSQAMDWLLN